MPRSAEPPALRRPVAVIVSRFPLVTETFILREIGELERQGQPVVLVPLLRERPRVVHREAEPWLERLVHAPLSSPAVLVANARALLRRPWRYVSTLVRSVVRSLPDANLAAGALAMFPRSVHLAEALERMGVRHVHAHFATHPTMAAMVIAGLAPEGLLGYSFTAHAHDIFVHRAGLGAKLRGARFVRCISRFNRDVLAKVAPDAAPRLHVVHVGVDAARIPVACDASAAPRLLCIAALKPYKGLPVLVDAMRLLRERGIDVPCDVVGEGPQRAEVESLISAAGLRESLRLLGARRQDEVAELVAGCSVFVLPSVVASDGQMEGIPVALMEAMAARRPVVSTRISGIPELIEDDRTGLLVAPGDAAQLAGAIERLLADAGLRERLGDAGREVVLREFSLDGCTAELLALFDEDAGAGPQMSPALGRLLASAGLSGLPLGLRATALRTDSRVTRLLLADPGGPRDIVLKEHLDREGASRPAAIRARDEHGILAALHARMTSPEAGVPRPLALDEASASVPIDACPGQPLDAIIRAARRDGAQLDLRETLHAAGRWLVAFQDAARGLRPLPGNALDPVDARLRDAAMRARRSDGVRRALVAYDALRASAKDEGAIVHGDFWPGNVFVSSGRVQVIDFEGLRGGHACEDAAWFLVHLALFFEARPLASPRLEQCEAAFVHGFGRSAGDAALRACRLAVAMELLARDANVAWRATRRLALERLLRREGA